MKTKNFISLLAVALVLLTSCEEREPIIDSNDSILPERFGVDLPDAISREAENKIQSKISASEDTLNGNEIYANLTTFIRVGENAAQIVEDIIYAIRVYQINKPMRLTYVSDEDRKDKNLVVEADVEFENLSWEYELTITDAESEGNLDGGKAIQVFWNQNPIKGIAILKPKNINTQDTNLISNAIFRIDYSEESYKDYEATMIVQIAELPLPSPLVEPFAMNALKMFAGKKGDVIDVYGNSNHPNARLFSDDEGFNWAFIASGYESSDIGVAEVGLPPSQLDENDKSVLLKTYSIKNVFETQIYALWPNIDSAVVAGYLHNTEAPGYFDSDGFIQGGAAPNNHYSELIDRLEGLSPYNPKTISSLTIDFAE